MKRLKNKFLIGEKYLNKKNLAFEIIGYSEKANYRKIRFDDSGFETEAQTSHIKTGSIRDYFEKSVYGVGFLGKKDKCDLNLLGRWKKMISRCYNEKDEKYKTYGADGVTVCDEWLNFKNYEKDIMKKENYSKMKQCPSDWSIDKDIMSNGVPVYCDESTIIITKSQNSKEVISRLGSPSENSKIMVDKLDMDGNYIETYEYIKQAGRLNNIHYQSICSVCKGKRFSAGGFRWRYSSKGDNNEN